MLDFTIIFITWCPFGWNSPCAGLLDLGMIMRFKEMRMRQIIGHEKVGKDSLDIGPGVWDHEEFTLLPK